MPEGDRPGRAAPEDAAARAGEVASRLSRADPELLDYLSYRAAERADERLRRREAQRNTRLTIALSIVALVGLGSITFLVNVTIERVVQNVVQGELEAQTSETRRSLTQAVAVIRFTDLVTRTLQDRDTKLTPDETATILALLKDLKDTDYQVDAGFMQHLETVVDELWESELYGTLDKIDDDYRETMLGAPGIVYTMLSHYGIQLVGAEGELIASDDLAQRFRSYERAARVGDYLETAVFWRLLLTFREESNVSSTLSDDLVVSIEHLDPKTEKPFLMHLFVRYSDPRNWQLRPTPEAVKVAGTVGALLEAYPDLRRQVEEAAAEPFPTAPPAQGETAPPAQGEGGPSA